MIWLWILTSILLLLFVGLMLPIHLHIRIKRVDGNDHMTFRMRSMAGLFRYTYQIPFINFDGIKGVRVHSKVSTLARQKKESDQNITFMKLKQFVKQSRQMITHARGVMEWVDETLNHIDCTKIRWSTQIGFGAADQTAVGVGIVWAVKSWLLELFCSRVQMKTYPEIDVRPLYNQSEVYIDGEIRLKIVTFHAVKAGLLLVIRVIGARNGLRTWKKILVRRMQ